MVGPVTHKLLDFLKLLKQLHKKFKLSSFKPLAGENTGTKMQHNTIQLQSIKIRWQQVTSIKCMAYNDNDTTPTTPPTPPTPPTLPTPPTPLTPTTAAAANNKNNNNNHLDLLIGCSNPDVEVPESYEVRSKRQ